MDSYAQLLAAACCVAHGLYALLRFRKNSLFAANVIIVDMSVACERFVLVPTAKPIVYRR